MSGLKPGYVIERFRDGEFEIEIEGPEAIAHEMMDLQIHLHKQDVPILCERNGMVYWSYPSGLLYPIAPADELTP
jgi:hypothetical protein